MLGQVVFNCIKFSACDIMSWHNDKTCEWLGKQFVEDSADKSYWKISASEERNCLMIIGVDAYGKDLAVQYYAWQESFNLNLCCRLFMPTTICRNFQWCFDWSLIEWLIDWLIDQQLNDEMIAHLRRAHSNVNAEEVKSI